MSDVENVVEHSALEQQIAAERANAATDDARVAAEKRAAAAGVAPEQAAAPDVEPTAKARKQTTR